MRKKKLVWRNTKAYRKATKPDWSFYLGAAGLQKSVTLQTGLDGDSQQCVHKDPSGKRCIAWAVSGGYRCKQHSNARPIDTGPGSEVE